MAASGRGTLQTVLAVLFALMAVANLSKALQTDTTETRFFVSGFVFFGNRLSGMPNTILATTFAILLVVYAAGIWRMRRYALYLAYGYAVYVTINIISFLALNPFPETTGGAVFSVVYMLGALTFTWGSAILLTRLRTQLN
jgi:hypothetical protein